MKLAILIIYLSAFVWLLPIIRQFNGRFRYFFIILGLSDPLVLILQQMPIIPLDIVHAVAAGILYQTLNYKEPKKWEFRLTDYLVAVISVLVIIIFSNLYIAVTIIHFLILLKVISIFLVGVHMHSRVNIFHMMIIFYEIITVLKLIIYLSGTQTDFIYLYITLFFQISLALFFTIFRESSTKLSLSISKST